MSHKPVPNVCRYRIKPGHEQDFEAILVRHWRTLHGAGLATDEPATIYRARDKAGNVAYIEMFAWSDHAAIDTAHESGEVMKLWEPMGAYCEDMEFWEVEPVDA